MPLSLLNDCERCNIVCRLGYKLAKIFARFVMGVLGDELGERESVGEFGPGEDTGEKLISALGGLET